MGLPLNTQALQKVDRWIGIPVCATLSVFRKLLRFLRPEDDASRPPRKLLFVKFAEQGSTVLAFPAISRAVEMVGRENVYFIVFEENRFILDVMDLIPRENVITIRHRGIVDMAAQALAALWRVHELEIDAAVDLEFFSRSSAALTYLTGARSRVGFHTFFGEGPYRGDLMTHRLLYNPYLHTSQIFQLMIEALGQSPRALPTYGEPPPRIEKWLPELNPNAEEQAEVRAILERETQRTGCGHGEGRFILLNPNASDLLPLRKWATERYVDLAGRLLARFPGLRIGLTGGPDEAEAAERVARQINDPRCFSLAGKTTLRQLLVLYTLCEALVTNDSGPAHFASMTPISVITLFGPETPSLFGARSSRNTALWKGIVCSPCVNAYNNRQSPCTNNVCMQQITVEEVFEAVCNALAKRGVGEPRAA
jgi:ADP-heptose:LPS heptosyltransferase